MSNRRGFTLIELLVVVTIMSILIGLLAIGLPRARTLADRTSAASQMREIGTAVMLYGQDHDDYLPGPMKDAQGVVFDLNQPDQLATVLASYLGGGEGSVPEVLKIFMPTAYAREMGKLDPAEARPFVMNINPLIEGQRVNPWGDSESEKTPLKLGRVGDIWGFTEADQLNPLVKGQAWAAKTPAKPVHGDKRLAWFFNGSVQLIEEDLLLVSVIESSADEVAVAEADPTPAPYFPAAMGATLSIGGPGPSEGNGAISGATLSLGGGTLSGSGPGLSIP